MLDPGGARKALEKVFAREKIVDLHVLCETLETRSRMSVFRRLSEMGYLTSYTHAGRYYTLERNACFDTLGLWFHEGVGFSRAGTLKQTVWEFVEHATAGKRCSELQEMLRLRGAGALYNTLGELVRAGRLERHRMEQVRVYTSAKPARAREQLAQRQAAVDRLTPLPSSEIVIAVLAEALRTAQVRIESARIAGRLQAQAIPVTCEQVEHVLRHYGLEGEKKTAG
jgi:hypothetical protein